jgi:hypothetical protein
MEIRGAVFCEAAISLNIITVMRISVLGGRS